MSPMTGAKNLLLNCALAQSSDRLLIAFEPEEFGYFNSDVLANIIRTAGELELSVKAVNVGFDPNAKTLPETLFKDIDQADIVVFLSRLGDQLRFSDMPVGKRIIVCFAQDNVLMESGFGTTHYDAMMQLNDLVTGAFAGANDVRVTCKRGTNFFGKPKMPPKDSGDTTMRRFPLSIFKPVPACSFTGRVALCGFLTGTGSQYYDDYTLEFEDQVTALLENGRVTGFEGSVKDVAAAEAHYDRVSKTFEIDRNCVHSWHAGIHPGCGYHQEARDNYERWGGAAFGNPRILHFHTCGSYAPGEISWNVLDPTIWIDGIPVWEDGMFHPARLNGGQDVLDSFPDAARIFAHPESDVGLKDMGFLNDPAKMVEAVH